MPDRREIPEDCHSRKQASMPAGLKKAMHNQQELVSSTCHLSVQVLKLCNKQWPPAFLEAD